MHILVVDDKPKILESITNLLAKFDITVESATNGLDGYEKAIKRHYDLYIVDHLMPIMNGLQLVKSLKSRPTTADTPILFMTTQELSRVEKLSEFPLFSAVMHKPIEGEIFYQLINKLLPKNTLHQSL
ncbi:response regulator [Thalassotalea piscium]